MTALEVDTRVAASPMVQAVRLLGWSMLTLLAVFILNTYLTYAREWQGPWAVFSEGAGFQAYLQFASYVAAFAIAIFLVLRDSTPSLRSESKRISEFNAFLIRAAFWGVLFVGLADMVISFLRVEGLLEAVVGSDLATELGRSQFRGPYVHVPLLIAGFVLGIFTRTLGFTWLALGIVAAELAIVFTRFVFSYEQAFMGDLVRFWYAALFLFASAYTLLEEGHVRVDVFYAGFGPQKKGYVNAYGSIFLGFTLCWTILIVGMDGKSAIITSPLLNYEISQSGFGMYVKYLMAGFLGVFAITMLIQFVSYLFDATADVRGDPGGRDHESHAVQ